MKNTKSKKALVGALAILGAMAMATVAQAEPPPFTPPLGTPAQPMAGPIIYVTSTGAAYKTVVLGGLPMVGLFQKLEHDGPTGLQTEWGPGAQEYVGGRWWVDENGDGEMNEGDVFFMCPLTVEVDI